MSDEATTCVALPYDVIEDTDMTFEPLQEEGFTTEILAALKLMTHDKNVPYLEYVGEIKKNAVATKVKLADLKHNSDVTRLDHIDEKTLMRAEKYKNAIALLTNK